MEGFRRRQILRSGVERLLLGDHRGILSLLGSQAARLRIGLSNASYAKRSKPLRTRNTLKFSIPL